MKKAHLVVTLLLVSGLFTNLFAQDKGNENTADNTLRGSGRVNASTLGMEFDLPLGSYPGRGINVPITMSYSSKVWKLDYVMSSPSPGANYSSCKKQYTPVFSKDAAAGWTTSMATPYIEYVGAKTFYDFEGKPVSYADVECPTTGPPSPSYPHHYVRRIVVHLPSGETHELRVDDTPIAFTSSGNQDINGPNQPYMWDATYYAADGSNIRYIQNSTTNTYRLQMPDGSYYDFDTTLQAGADRKATKFSDRNGNFTTYHAPDATYPHGRWTDTLGRTISAPLGLTAPTAPTTAQQPQVYSMPGMTGTYKFHWKQLKGSSAAESGLSNFSDQLKYLGDTYGCYNGMGFPTHCTRPAADSLFVGDWETRIISNSVFNPIVLTEVELPTGVSYKFSYDIYGRIEKISYPTGGEEKFQYGIVPTLTMLEPSDIAGIQSNFGVTNRKVYEFSGDTTPYEWTYSATYVSPTAGYVVTINNPDGTRAERYLHRGYDGGSGLVLFGYDIALAGMAYEERGYNSANQLVSKKITNWTMTPIDGAQWHPRVTSTESQMFDYFGNGVSTTSTNQYEGDLSLRSTPLLGKGGAQYAFVTVGSALPSTPVRTSETTFLINDTNVPQAVRDAYKAQNMIGLATASVVKDSVGNIVSRSEMLYDESGYSPGYRGNPTTSKVWDSTKGANSNANAYLSTKARFDQWGNQYETIDAKGIVTSTTTFDSTYHAFPIQVTSAVPDSTGDYGSNAAFVTTTAFNTVAGIPTSTTDPNGLETRIEYDPVTLRPLNTKKFYQNQQVGGTAEVIYHDEQNNYWVKNRAQIDANNWSETISYYDGLGRAYKAEEVNSEGNIFVEKLFDPDGRVLKVSNPYRAGEVKKWTTNVYDESSRVKEVILQDGAAVKTEYGVSVSGILGVTKTVTDQAGKKRKGVSDALGRMVRVIEDPTGQNLSTDYVFDTLGNLRKTIQGVQSRYFTYDSLGRLLYAKQPEQNAAFTYTDSITGNAQWSVKYEYDNNGNITKTTDARGVYVEGTYDNFNRLRTRNYSDDTPDVTFWYDGRGLPNALVPNFSKGKTTRVASSVSENRYTNFSVFGQLERSEQLTPFGTETPASATPQVSVYEYDSYGRLLSQTYPSQRKVNFDYNLDGDIASIWGTAGSQNRLYLNGITYNSSGQMTRLRLGNGKWESTEYNDRLQVTQIGLGHSASDQNILKLEYGYGTNTQNNGSLRSQKITFGGLTQAYEQTYTYDDLNRLLSAEEKVGTTTNWKQTFIFDRYGNRTFDAANTTTLGASNNITNPAADTATNRLVGQTYDAAGNLTIDAANQRQVYDAENHQTKLFLPTNNSATPDAVYQYDGEGRRVRKISPTESTVFVYDGGGQLIAEYTGWYQGDPAPAPQVSYLTQDHLGSTRVITNQNGQVIKRSDYMAYGDEVEFNKRQTGLGYDEVSETRKGYTGYERDTESGLDFAQARYYNSKHGRFTSVDPLTASANVKDPQTFNRYTYALNSPYKFTDPLGLISSATGATGDFVDEDGYVIGSDGEKDANGNDTKTIYFVPDKADRDTIIENTKNKKTTNRQTVTTLELPNANVRQEIGVDAVNRSNGKTTDDKKGKNHEEGGRVYETKTGQIAVPAKPGPVGTPGKVGGATINTADAANPALMNQVTDTTPLLTYHVHPADKDSELNQDNNLVVKEYTQTPSEDKDIPNAAKTQTKFGYNLVVGARDKTVSFYNGNGTIGKMTRDGFTNAGRKKK